MTMFEGREQITLAPLRFGARTRISSHLYDEQGIRFVRDVVCDQLVAQLDATVYARQLCDETVTRTANVRTFVPASTWQMLKSRSRLLGWLRRWRPVRYDIERTVEVTLTARWRGHDMFPESTVRYPESFGAPVRYWQTDADVATREL